jgi:hypothetical protein
MKKTWHDLLHGEQWRSRATLWVEDDAEHSWQEVDDLATSIERALHARGSARVVLIRSGTKLGCFAGQLGAWRAGWAAVVDDGTLGPDEIDHVRPNVSLSIYSGMTMVEGVSGARIPDSAVAVNFTSGST